MTAFFALSGCAGYRYKGPPALPADIHTIAVRPFANHTQQYGLEDKLTIAVQSELSLDGHYPLSTEDKADGILIGDITRYVLDPLSYDTNHVPTEYKLSIVVTVSFFDKVQNHTLWTEPDMRGELRYFVSSSGYAGSMTEDEARQTINDLLARDIRTRTIEGTGGSKEKTTSTDAQPSTGTYTAPPVVDNGPPAQPPLEPAAPSPTRLPY